MICCHNPFKHTYMLGKLCLSPLTILWTSETLSIIHSTFQSNQLSKLPSDSSKLLPYSHPQSDVPCQQLFKTWSLSGLNIDLWSLLRGRVTLSNVSVHWFPSTSKSIDVFHLQVPLLFFPKTTMLSLILLRGCFSEHCKSSVNKYLIPYSNNFKFPITYLIEELSKLSDSRILHWLNFRSTITEKNCRRLWMIVLSSC